MNPRLPYPTLEQVEEAERSELSFWVNELPGDGGDDAKWAIMHRICERIASYAMDPHQPRVRKGKPFNPPAAKPAAPLHAAPPAKDATQEAAKPAASVITAPAAKPAQEAAKTATTGKPKPKPATKPEHEPAPPGYFKSLFSPIETP